MPPTGGRKGIAVSMTTPEKLSLSDFVSRRLHPVKVTIELLNHEVAKNTDKGVTHLKAGLLNSAIQTIMMFVEDYDKLMEKTTPGGGRPASERRFVGEDGQ